MAEQLPSGSFLALPEPILLHILSFLPQQETINVALTNYDFYLLCLRKLYRRISIQLQAPMRSLAANAKKRDAIDSNYTAVYGFLGRTSEENHLKLLDARIQALTQSLSINTQLAEYVEEVCVDDLFDGAVLGSLKELFAVLAKHGSATVKRIYIGNFELRQKLNYADMKSRFPALESVTIDHWDQLAHLQTFKNVSELIVDGIGPETRPMSYAVPSVADTSFQKTIDALCGIKHLYVSSSGYSTFMRRLHQFLRLRHFKLDLKTFTMVHNHSEDGGMPDLAYSFINFATIQNLQLSVGCHYGTSCESHCIDLLCHELSFILSGNLRKLAILQLLERKNHASNEHWDIAVLSFLKRLTASYNNLTYLSIRHDTGNSTGIINDGFEGNYLRRMKIYTEVLPQLLKRNQRRKLNLILPTLVSSLAFYEPAMNTMIWNGCKCGHCDVYLKRLDDFLFHHQYKNTETGLYKDLVSSNVIYAIGEVLQKRHYHDAAVGDLQLLKKPLKTVQWDFHTVDFSPAPLKCLPHENFKEGEFEDDREARKQPVSGQTSSDANVPCRFLAKEAFANYAICMAHYADDLILKMVSLNRGNAEDVLIGTLEDENDGAVGLELNKVVISGITYHIDKETNGTAFFENAFDGGKDRSQGHAG